MQKVLPRLLAAALSLIRLPLLGAALYFSPGLALAQAPPPVPALPDAERRTSYSLSSSTCACSVNFALYGTGTDVDQWIQVWVGGVAYLSTDPTFGWSISSATGPLSTIPRPITDAKLTFNNGQTGTVEIMGAERPRRLAQFAENRGVAARDLNLVLTDIVAVQRETWDKLNNATGRTLQGLPEEHIAPLPSATARAGGFLCWDGTGLVPLACGGGAGTGNVTGPNSSTNAHIAVFVGTTGKVLADGGAIPGAGTITGPGSSTNLGFVRWNGTTGLVIQDGPATIGAATGGTGATALTAHGVVIGEGTSAVAVVTDTTGGKLLNSASGADPNWTASPILGVDNTTAGTLQLANGSAAFHVILQGFATANYNFNLPAGAGASGQIFTSGGGASAPNTWTSVTGSGSVVEATSPTLVTPILGVAGATSLNGILLNATGTSGAGTLSTYVGNRLSVAAGNANSFFGGDVAGFACTACTQSVMIGTGAGQSSVSDIGSVFIGYLAGNSQNNPGASTWNVMIGHAAGLFCTTCGSSVFVGRAAGYAETTGPFNTGVGHGSLTFGSGNSEVTAIGDGAGGGVLGGSAIPAGFPNVGVNVFGFNGDSNLECIGETCGKATSAVRKQSFCIGSYCRIPARDNSGWLGNGMASIGTAGQFYHGMASSPTLNSNVGVTLTCAQLLGGVIDRTGAPGAGFTDTTPTAQQIVQCTTFGAGNNGEVPILVDLYYLNDGTGQTATMGFGSGVSHTAPSGITTANNNMSHWLIEITSSTPASEAVTLWRVQ